MRLRANGKSFVTDTSLDNAVEAAAVEAAADEGVADEAAADDDGPGIDGLGIDGLDNDGLDNDGLDNDGLDNDKPPRMGVLRWTTNCRCRRDGKKSALKI